MSRLISVGYTIAVPPEVGRQIERLARESYHVLATGHTLRNFLLVAHSFRYLLGILLLKTGAFDGKSTVPPSRDFSKNIEFMHNNLSRPLTLQELAKQAGLSPSRYSALFKAQTGAAPIEHHIGLRIHAACSLLVTSTLSIKEIAARLGYEDPLYFSRLFRKTMGTSPSDYRRGAKG
jgi:AraC-like DNA-binding protein